MSRYLQMPGNQPMQNGLTLLQVNPHVAADMRSDSPDNGWLFKREFTGKPHEFRWTKFRMMDALDWEVAYEQSADMMVLHGPMDTGRMA